ncbi:HEAT repeat domain-containing protein [Vreelandella sp. TE19]
MTQAGGPAAINGFLYQILHHLAWITEVSLSGTIDGELIDDARLVLEPRNGGDARAEATSLYLVEQYKSRKNGTWSVNDIVSVLADLRKSIPAQHPAYARYRFVTDGQEGRLEPLRLFLTDVESAVVPDDLDRLIKRKFSSRLICTNSEFFDHIVVASRAIRKLREGDERIQVFHLLQHLQLEFESDSTKQAYAVDKLLRRYAPNLGDESGIRERLVGILVEKLSKGEAKLDRQEINDMFRKVGLNPERMVRLEQLAETMGERTRNRLDRMGYRPECDVRNPPDWPDNKPVLLIAGTSGMGKTWQLGRLLETLAQSREIVTLVPSNSASETVLKDAAQDIWQTGLDETSEKSLVAVARFLCELVPNAKARKVTIAVDDVQDVDVARALIRQDWDDLGMRLVMTLPLNVAQAIKLSDSEYTYLHPVVDFSTEELNRLLLQNDRSWLELPPDLKRLLRIPILAGLYLKLPYSSIQRAPRSEYEIFEYFWTRIALKGVSSDAGIVLALASSYIGGESYPLPRHRWNEIGLIDGNHTQLEATGWLRTTDEGEVVFAHDRLLNWAVAKELVRKYQRKELSEAKLGEFFSGGINEDQPRWRRLKYMPMDTIWLLGESNQYAKLLSAIIVQMEQSREFGSYGKELYTQLLPTLGQRAVSILLYRLNSVVTENYKDRDYRAGLIGQSLAILSRQDHVNLSETTSLLLRSNLWSYQKVAIEVLTEVPVAAKLDRLWEIHQHCVIALEESKNSEGYKASMGALRSGVALNPEWLRRRILSIDPSKESVWDLGYLLNSLEHPDALAIWSETGDQLVEKMPASKPRSLLYCITRFNDRDKIDFVINHLSKQQDFASGAALNALSVLNPSAAIDRLEEVSEAERYYTRNLWLPGLLHAEPEVSRHRLLALAKAQPKGHHVIEILFGERPDEINEEMLRFVLSTLEKNLLENLDAINAGDVRRLDRPLKFLASITRPDLLAIIMSQKGRELERMLTIVSRSRLMGNSRAQDDILESARRLLILFGGEGITALVRHELESEHYWVRYGGLNWAFVRQDSEIIERLAAIARRPIPRDAIGKFEAEPYSDFYKAVSGLSALGADAHLVDAVFEIGIPEVPLELVLLRLHQGPMLTALMKRAILIMEDRAAVEDELCIALIIAWISNNKELIPTVREVLIGAIPTSRLAVYLCITLSELGDKSEEFAQFAFQVAQTEENLRWGIDALASLGDCGAKLMLEWLKNQNGILWSRYEIFVIRMLYRLPETRDQAIVAAVRACEQVSNFDEIPYDIAAEANDPELRDKILDEAFSEASFVVTRPLKAIEGLAKFNMARAVDAIELAFQAHPKIERELARLLVRLAPDVAAEKLINAAVMIERESIRSAVGRALRQLDPAIIAPLFAERVKGTASERKVIAELAAWLPLPQINNVLVGLADQDSASEVRHSALQALEYHRKEVGLRALLEDFKTADYDKRWSLLTAILNGADAHLLKSRDDPLWLGNILTDELPFIFEHHANNVLEQRIQQGK